MRSMFPVLATFAGILALMAWGFDAVIERRARPNVGIISGAQGPQKVELRRNHRGQYVAPGQINGRDVSFLIDTGADSVAVPAEIADRLGLPRGAAIQTMTAAGLALAYETHIDYISIGGIELENIRGAIIPADGHLEVLLGMSFLRHLDFQKSGDRLILEPSGAGER